MEEFLEQEKDAECRTSAVYQAYRNWCNDNGYFAENSRNFNQALCNRYDSPQAPKGWRRKDYTFNWISALVQRFLLLRKKEVHMRGQVGYLGCEYLDGKLIRKDAVKVLQMAAD